MTAAALAAVLLWAAPAAAETLAGVDVLARQGFSALKGKKVGLITNHTGVDRRGRSTVTVLAAASGVELKALFSPEHGFLGMSEADAISSSTYRLYDGREIPLYSLYGATKAPTADMLKGLDALVFDVQDVGARFYTYPTTMGLAMEAAAKTDLDFFVLDRPNPIGGDAVEGPLLDPDVRHFTAYFPVPVRHGLTIGEIARLHNLAGRVGARLQVIGLEGWSRSMWYDQTGLKWRAPSPNMPVLEAAALYPGIGCFEASNVAVGRGTPLPFRWVGAPWMDAEAVAKRLNAAELPGVRFSAKAFTPKKSVFAGKKCRGVRIEVTDRARMRPLSVFVHFACALRDLHPLEFGVRWEEMWRLAGKGFQALYESGAKPSRIIAAFDADAEKFKTQRALFLLY